jgi:hypothetical protein
MEAGVTSAGAQARTADRRHALVALVRSLLAAAVVLAGYCLLPMTRLGGSSLLALVLGLAVLAMVLGWHIREIRRSPYPRMRAVEGLVTTLTLFFALFATTYYVMSSSRPGSFSEQLSRLDAAYFTVTVFATVGFGDIVAVDAPARLAATVQMLTDLALIGVVARMVINAVQVGLQQRGAP